MNAERAKRREKIAVRLVASMCVDPDCSWESMIRAAMTGAEMLMDKLDAAALADTPDADPVHETAAMQDLQAAKDAAANRSVAKSILIFQRDRQIADLEEQLAALKQRADGCEELDELRLENTSLNQTVATLDRQIGELNAELSRLRENDGKLAALNEFVEGVLNEASKSPELYGPFVRLVRDLDAKVGAK